MLIRLEHNGVLLHETDDTKIAQEITIGRSSQCAWRVPAEDRDVSGTHARLFKKGGSVWIEDLGSSNGTYYRSKTIKKLKLKRGMKVSIGGCILSVEAGGLLAPAEQIPEIVVVSGKNRGERKEIRPPVFTIGSDPGASLILLDLLVSRRHSEIQMKDDKSCWIRDLGSKNGTAVNDTPLRSGQERLLKDGDKISFAHIEARFSDGTTKKSGKKVWLRLGVMLATLVLVAGLYSIWQLVRPSSGTYLERARASAAEQEFGTARQQLDKASNARGAKDRTLEIQDMSRLVTLWDGTVQTWLGAQGALEEGDWIKASRDLGSLQSLRQDAWNWSPEGSDERTAALKAKQMLDALLRAGSALRGEEASGASLQAELTAVQGVLASQGEVPAYLAKARTELLDIQSKMELFLSESRDLEKALDAIAGWPPPYESTIVVLENTYRNSRGLLKRRSELMVDPVKSLARSYGLLQGALKLAQDMKFNEALQVAIELPSTSACALDSRVSKARANIESHHEQLTIQLTQLMYLFRELAKIAPDVDTGSPAQMAAWKNREAVARALACDSLGYPMPRRSRKDASGDYDRYFGIEEFYDYLQSVALRQPWKPSADAAFTTVLRQTHDLVEAIESIQAFFAKSDWAVQLTAVNTSEGVTRLEGTGPKTAADGGGELRKETEWLLDGKLAEHVKLLQQILEARDELVTRALNMANQEEGRGSLLAAGFALRLAASPAGLQVKNENLDAYVSRNVREVREKLRALSQEYDLARPARQIEIRDEILETGLPGDPIVKRMWSSMTNFQ